ncbi:major facilitator superfamily domain-containing protein [Aspergillus pseudodeflectus]|uniref:Major facilitator superfamily domain-containing protein n=1 Tax=Aspergillus pseudodeflectus TaxID=176178 RepID=A0ABR4KBS0_9EURO
MSDPTSPPKQEPYHILSKNQKWNLVIFVSLAGCFSPLSSNIYFPAIDTISNDLGISASLVSLTITVYMVVQGIAPSLFGALSDSCGRRLTFAISLTIYTAANLALAFTSSYPMLMALRGLQAAGSAATISISAGVIADIAAPQERGGFMGTNAGVRMMGQAVGPVIGGLLNSAWGFRSIFWLLFVMSVIVLGALLIFLPETQRSIAGNGSIPLTGFHKPLAYTIKPPTAWARNVDSDPIYPKPRAPISLKKAFSPLAYILEKDIAALLAWGAIAYTAWSMVTSSTTTMLLHGFPFLTQWQLGLCFLPNGVGCICGSLSTGWLLNYNFRRVEAKYKSKLNLGDESDNSTTATIDSANFPYIKARLQLMPLFSTLLVISLALYGPSFEFNDLHRSYTPNLAAPLILQFLIAFTSTAIFNINSTVLIDSFPDRPASATALNNLCRCLLGAAGVSAIQPLIDAVKAMRAFFIVTGVVVAFSPLVWVVWMWGERWRVQREERIKARNLGTAGL